MPAKSSDWQEGLVHFVHEDPSDQTTSSFPFWGAQGSLISVLKKDITSIITSVA